MTMIETIIQDWCEDLTDQLDSEAHLLGVADREVLRQSFSHWIVNDLRFLVGDALDSAHQGLLIAHGPTEAASILRAEAASGPNCELLSSVFPAATSLLASRLAAAATAIRELLCRYVDDKESLDALCWHGPVASIEVGL
ncbi:hypothetical protein, partial [Nocardioides sp.]|uniref:hypothetical protein n=1 Tax=Nocardioides sp. TaxID=35761 RepID=UPI0019A4A07A